MMILMTTMMARIINFVLERQHLTECTFFCLFFIKYFRIYSLSGLLLGDGDGVGGKKSRGVLPAGLKTLKPLV